MDFRADGFQNFFETRVESGRIRWGRPILPSASVSDHLMVSWPRSRLPGRDPVARPVSKYSVSAPPGVEQRGMLSGAGGGRGEAVCGAALGPPVVMELEWWWGGAAKGSSTAGCASLEL